MTGMQDAAATTPAKVPLARVALAVVLVGAVAVAVWAGVAAVVHVDEPEYALRPGHLLWSLSGAAAVLAGAWLLWRSASAAVALMSLFTALLWGLVLLGMLSIGVFVLPFAILALVLLVRVANRRGWGGASGSLLVAYGLVALLIVAPWEPLVSCDERGVSTSGRRVGGSGAGGSEIGHVGRDGSGGDSSGTISTGGRTYTWTCRDGELVEFRTVS